MQKRHRSSITSPTGNQITYVKTDGKTPGVIFFGGYMSDMSGTKALALEMLASEIGHSYVRFDYSGHGSSTGLFENGTIGRWSSDALAIFDEVTAGPQVLVGSSMGGWIMLLIALARQERVHGLVGIAPAVDFTKRMLDEELTAEQLEFMKRDGFIQIRSPYADAPYKFTEVLLEDGAQHTLLDQPINLHCPVRLLHGVKDESVPWQISERLSTALCSENVDVLLIKNGDHRLSTTQDILRLQNTVKELIETPGT